MVRRESSVYLYRLDFELHSSILIHNHHTARMKLQTRQCAQVTDTPFDCLLDSRRLCRSRRNDNHLPRIHDRLHTNRESHARHQTQIITEKPRIRDNSLMSQRLDSSATSQTRTRFIECNMSITPNAAEEQLNSTKSLNLHFVRKTLFAQIRRVSVQYIDILRVDVNMTKEVRKHERVIRFRVVARQTHVLVHVERDHILKRYFALIVGFDEGLVYA
jgi:hypothetical protein